ncbi:PiggyBac transposable element-derived protein 4 [Plakobranchus ocellatus]|uniref:PiggyBac transposable element-derived protein 4 n=1 Tax=Plakobranchus ocellatus TaxID=259542 RepID=A0AAV4BI82_9GAST|nr:PiggyBac transposable element-derived protein 4 [Plakobranchus ocellatus]
MAVKIFYILLAHFGTVYHILADRWCPTGKLVDHLTGKSTDSIQVGRKNFPPNLKTQKLAHMELSFQRTDGDKLINASFKDKKVKKPVSLVSSCNSIEFIPVQGKQKPIIMNNYNQYMNGCDRADQNLGNYRLCERKLTKLEKVLFLGNGD